MKTRIEYPLYDQAYKAYIEGNYETFEYRRKSNELTQVEKEILKARSHVKKREWDRVIEILGSITSENLTGFLMAEICLIKASAYSWSGDKQNSYIFNTKAQKIYSVINDRIGQFIANYNSSVAAHKLGMSDISLYHLNEAKKFTKTYREKSLISRALSCHYSQLGDLRKAYNHIEDALSFEQNLNRVDLQILYSIASDIYFRCGEKDKAEKFNRKVCLNSSNFERPRVLLQNRLLECFGNEGNKMGKVPSSIKSSREYLLKWELLNFLEDKDFEGALQHWGMLSKMFPGIYGEDFKPLKSADMKSVFFQYVEKLAPDNKVESINNPLRKNTKAYLLLDVLIKSKRPISKYDLIEKVWKKQYSDGDDDRFYQMIRVLKKQTNFTISSKNSFYFVS